MCSNLLSLFFPPKRHGPDQNVQPSRWPRGCGKKQFGVKLEEILANYQTAIPPIVTQCINFLERPENIVVEGLLRKSSALTEVKKVIGEANSGKTPHFRDAHVAAHVLKTFLRDLKEPLLTANIFKDIEEFQNQKQQVGFVLHVVKMKLPKINYQLLKHLVLFLHKVAQYSDQNKMNPNNLAIVIAPNLMWSKEETLEQITNVTRFVEYLIQNAPVIFKDSPQSSGVII